MELFLIKFIMLVGMILGAFIGGYYEGKSEK